MDYILYVSDIRNYFYILGRVPELIDDLHILDIIQIERNIF